MTVVDVLTDKNFLLYCAKHYNNPACTGTDEFFDDLRRIKYIKKLITRYIETGELKERLILNHIIVLSNVFNSTALCRILWLKMEPQFGYIKPYLVGIGKLVPTIDNVKQKGSILTDNVIMDQGTIDALRTIYNA